MFSDSYRRRCESDDRISRNFSEYIRAWRPTATLIETGRVQLPSATATRGLTAREYIPFTSGGFDPNVGSNVEWRRLERSP